MLQGPKKFIEFLGMVLMTRKLKSLIIENEFSVFLFLFALSVYYFLFLFILTLLELPAVYRIVLAVIALHAYCFIFLARFVYFLTFENSSLLNPKAVYPEISINTSKIVKRYPFFYLSHLGVDILFILILLTGPGAAWLFSVAALIVFLDAFYLILYRLFLHPIKKATQGYFSEQKTEIIVYLSGMLNTEYQLEQWLPVLERLSHRYKTTIILYEAHFIPYGTRLAVPAMRIVNIRKLSEIIDNGNVKAVFYVNHCGANYYMLFYSKYIHIHLNHGDSDKAANAESTSKDYDYLFIAGQASVDRHLGAGWDREKLRTVGRPQLEFLQAGKMERKEGGKKTVLYAPTYEGSKEVDCYSSVQSMGMEIVRRIIEGGKYRLVVKLHPYTGLFLEEYRRISEEMKRCVQDHRADAHLWVDQTKPEIGLYELFLDADVMISDISSVAIDYLALNRPIVATDPFGTGREKGEAIYPFWRGSHILAPGDDVVKIIDEAVEKDPMRSGREKVAKYYLGDNVFNYEGMADNFIKTVDEIIENQAPKK